MFSGPQQTEVLIYLHLFDSYNRHNESILMFFQKDNSGRKKFTERRAKLIEKFIRHYDLNQPLSPDLLFLWKFTDSSKHGKDCKIKNYETCLLLLMAP